MKTKFSKSWIRSKQPRKQRKYRHNAPLHVKQKMIHAHLSKELRKRHNKRNMSLRKGDSIKVLRGQFKNKIGKIDEVSLKKTKVYVGGVEFVKRDGTKSRYPLNPSNVMITELNMDDKLRVKIAARK
jgi:large subunit ribosomal protein L24